MTPTAPRPRPGRLILAALLTTLTLSPAARAAEPWTALADPDNALSLHFLHDGKPVFGAGLSGWGPKWAWVGMQSKPKADGEKLSAGVPFVVNKDALTPIDGYLPVPEGPGLGIDIDEAAVREADKDGHRWRNPIFRNKDGSFAEW